MKNLADATVIKNEPVSGGVFRDMLLYAPEISSQAAPGQFVNVYTGDPRYILPRPISVCRAEGGNVRLVFQVIGKGTEIFSKLKVGDSVKMLGPLGNGYVLPQTNGVNALIGGGIGLPPLLELAARLKGETKVFVGSKTSNNMLIDEFKALGCSVYIATDDGSEGFKGNVAQLLAKNNPQCDNIFACGPKPMLKAAADWAAQNGKKIQVSMEERMACGIGACVGCAIKIKNGDGFENKKVCKDGPVFWGSEVLWQ